MSCSGAFLFWRGCQYDTKADTERIITDHNPHVLYLRAFLSDSSTRKFILSTAFMAFPQATLEEQLADVVRPLGDLVAIGRPGEGLPEPGAARMYASDEEWKEVVNRRQLLAARLVIIRAGVGENLLWEAKHAVETLSPEKVLIFVFNMKAKDYESFRTKATQTLAVSLPELMRLRPFFGRVSGFIDFGTDWKPGVLPLPRFPHLYLRISSFKPYLAHLKFALKPVFERFGLEWRPSTAIVGAGGDSDAGASSLPHVDPFLHTAEITRLSRNGHGNESYLRLRPW